MIAKDLTSPYLLGVKVCPLVRLSDALSVTMTRMSLVFPSLVLVLLG